jgi:hypothetical protein
MCGPLVLELKTRTHRKILNSAGDKHLIRGCESRHPGPDVDGQPSHVVSNQFALAGMESSPNLDPELAKAVPNSAGSTTIPRLGPENVTKKPSPVVFTSRPPKRVISRRTAAA